MLHRRHLAALAPLSLALLAASAGAQSSLYSKYGGSPSAYAGLAVDGGVDLNGDGYRDFLYGVPFADLGGHTNNGAVRVIDGLTGAVLATKQGLEDDDVLGTSVSWAGDVDQDGTPDFIAGAPNGLNGALRTGYARVYSGADFSVLFTVKGGVDGGDFGRSVAGRIDADLDGHNDVLVGAPREGNIIAPEGRVHVYSGATGSNIGTLGGTAGSLYGWSLANAGFVDGNNRRDFIVGSPGTGQAYVYSGTTFALLHNLNPGFGVFGWDVEGGFDVNADGVDDLAVGATLIGNGTLYVYDGATGAELTSFGGDAFGDDFGISVARLGDVDGDGGDDLVVGSDASYAKLVSPAREAVIGKVTGAPGDGFGVVVGRAGNTNADGLLDLLIASPYAANLAGDSNAGRVELFSSAPWFMTYCTAGTSSSGCTASISATGVPSATAASGFDLAVTGVEGDKSGLFFFGANGRQASPWGNGTSLQCVTPPVKRGALQAKNGTSGSCDGAFTEDLNARWCPSCPKSNHNFGVGAIVQAQYWHRDPGNTSNQTTGLSNAIEFVLAP